MSNIQEKDFIAQVLEVERQRDIQVAKDIIAPFLKEVKDSSFLQSLLYDIDLLPEQIRTPVNAVRMVAIVKISQKLTQEQMNSLRDEA